ncbi:Crp/Fnr family transcriptional regulator [Sphingomonas sp. CGMCC 1.13654]|uniref:Crp/Fnr family transcriptional regulator n=2 Tax=Sphingomonas chungangi TaxID=2683589 RepID=A0A838L5Z1_9SPHN|nr:Crp/Fnr family transcriptional regulator [Sphingomonas chungangi]MVW57496.1 helix-turn-helix domain-containing protein [Sphingomonas chungangi]
MLERAVTERRRLPARSTLLERGDALRQSTMLINGFMIRYIDDLEGRRQVVAFHVPGDFVDLHGYPLEVLDHSIATLTEVEIANVPHSALKQLTDRDAEFARKLWASTLLDAAMHREWLFRLGRLDAGGRVAHFLAETNVRLGAIGRSDGSGFDLPITQTDLSEITGLTSIHVNRVLRMMREERICTFRSSRVEIADLERLERIAQFDPTYLYVKAGVPGSQAATMETSHG